MLKQWTCERGNTTERKAAHEVTSIYTIVSPSCWSSFKLLKYTMTLWGTECIGPCSTMTKCHSGNTHTRQNLHDPQQSICLRINLIFWDIHQNLQLSYKLSTIPRYAKRQENVSTVKCLKIVNRNTDGLYIRAVR